MSGSVLDGVDWTRFTVALLKPDCLRRDLVDDVLDRLRQAVELVAVQRVTVADWQIFIHYWDLVVDRDWFSIDVVDCLRRMYVGHDVVVALGLGSDHTTADRLRRMLGHFDPSKAAAGTIRGDLGVDSLRQARTQGRLVENLIHTSDDPAATCRDFGVWFGANQHRLLDLPTTEETPPPEETR